jgi:hypothetical protein
VAYAAFQDTRRDPQRRFMHDWWATYLAPLRP